MVYLAFNVRTKDGQQLENKMKNEKQKKKTTSYNLPVNLRQKLKNEAKEARRSVSAQLGLILEEYFAAKEKKSDRSFERAGVI